MIFFDWGKSELSGDGKATLDRIATEFAASGKAQLTLSSHSDRSGSSIVNLAMSRKRAEVAAAYLESKGIAPAAIRIVAVGEADQLIQTDDGVREIQNRRIDIQF
ncbi:OmpA family protein [Sphingomonas jaspsi]|uniref:OmpA family protein n=1 Tax=Sphingomonas jaspsi TaxID=392409 RepID=UPI0004BBFD28|nr:OmpA family protein [Sphingomonas jaspsi]